MKTKEYLREDIVVIDEEDNPLQVSTVKDQDQKVDEEGSPQRKTSESLAYDSALMIWDGLPFFGFDETKLARLTKNGKYAFTDKCTSIQWILGTIASLGLFIAVIISQAKNLGQVKGQSIQLKS